MPHTKINVTALRKVIARMALVLLSLSAVLSADANAATTPYQRFTVPYVTGSFATKDSACAALAGTNPNVYTAYTTDNSYCNLFGSSGQSMGTYPFGVVTVTCTDPEKPNAAGQCTAPTTCAGYASPELAVTNSYARLQNPVCARDPIDPTQLLCSGTTPKGQQVNDFKYSCGGSHSTGVVPDPVPNPPPPVEVSWPDCPAGSFGYIDVQAGTSSCSTPEPTDKPEDPVDCASGNAGTVNGKFVCLPANPAPAVAQAAADSAQAKANEAKATPGTQAAQDAAKQASIDAQKAVDAANSKPDDAAAQANAKRAIEAARQASGHAGVPYNGPAGTGSGAGTGNGTGGGSGSGTGGNGNADTGPRECGTPGRPKCQIDETGTPTNGDATMKVGKDALDAAVTAHTQALDQVTSGDGKDTSWGWIPSVPHSTCTPIEFANLGTLDWCATAPSIQEVMSWLWSLTAVIFVIAMTSSTIKGN